MKVHRVGRTVAVLAIMALAGAWSTGHAVVPPDNTPISPAPATVTAPVNASAMTLPYGVPQILKLAQAKVSDDTIIAYVQNTGNSYNLDADQILWLRQQGISDAVLTAMLSQPRAGVAPSSSAMPPPQPVAPPVYPGAYPTAPAPYPVPDNSATVDTSDYGQPVYYYNSQPYYYCYYPGYGYCYTPYYLGWGYRGYRGGAGYRGWGNRGRSGYCGGRGGGYGFSHGGGAVGFRGPAGGGLPGGGGPAMGVGHGGGAMGGHAGGAAGGHGGVGHR